MARTTVYLAQVVVEQLAQRGSRHVRVLRVRRSAADEARKLQQSIKTHSSIAYKRIAAHTTRDIDLLHTRMLLAASETRVEHKQVFIHAQASIGAIVGHRLRRSSISMLIA